MSSEICRALAACLACTALVIVLGAADSAAASSDKGDAVAAHRGHRVRIVHRSHHGSLGHAGYSWRYVRPPPPDRYENVPPGAFIGPGYVFVPGKGILGESCDLPTSACPNEYRDVQ